MSVWSRLMAMRSSYGIRCHELVPETFRYGTLHSKNQQIFSCFIFKWDVLQCKQIVILFGDGETIAKKNQTYLSKILWLRV